MILCFRMALIYMPITEPIFRSRRSYTPVSFAWSSLASFPVNATPFWSPASLSTNLPVIRTVLANVSTPHLILFPVNLLMSIIIFIFYFKVFYCGIIPKLRVYLVIISEKRPNPSFQSSSTPPPFFTQRLKKKKLVRCFVIPVKTSWMAFQPVTI
jgi:hypothetical protein